MCNINFKRMSIMKEKTKKNVLTGAIGAAAGAVGAAGATGLNEWLKNNENEELDDELDDDVVSQHVPFSDDDEEEDMIDDGDIVPTDNNIAQNDADEIMPVDSGGMGQVSAGGDQVAMIDVNPDEIAQEIVAEPVGDEDLMASHGEDMIDGDIDALFDDEEPGQPEGELADVEFDEEEVEELEDVEADDDFADTGDDEMLDDMVDDIG